MKLYFKNNSKKGQAALEFMMTYGWAILVVLSAIGALSYFGVLNPSRFTPDTCLASAPFSCPGKPLAAASPASTVTFSLINGQGFDIDLIPINNNINMNLSGTLANCSASRICPIGNTACSLGAVYRIAPGQGATFQATNCVGSITSTTNIVKGDAIFYYTNPDSRLQEQILVSVTAKPR